MLQGGEFELSLKGYKSGESGTECHRQICRKQRQEVGINAEAMGQGVDWSHIVAAFEERRRPTT